MKQQTLNILKTYKDRAGYFGISPNSLYVKLDEQRDDCTVDNLIDPTLLDLEQSHQVYLTRSSQVSDRGEITLICYREPK